MVNSCWCTTTKNCPWENAQSNKKGLHLTAPKLWKTNLIKKKSRQPQIGILTTKTCLFSRYETSSDLLNDLDCQKKAICEVYQNALELGEISKRARHSLDFLDSASVLSVPDEFLDIIDEFTVSYLNIKEMSQLTTVFENHPKSIIYTW